MIPPEKLAELRRRRDIGTDPSMGWCRACREAVTTIDATWDEGGVAYHNCGAQLELCTDPDVVTLLAENAELRSALCEARADIVEALTRLDIGRQDWRPLLNDAEVRLRS